MKAKNQDGIVVEYNVLPISYKINNIPHNLKKLPEVVHEQEGFFRVVEADITIYQRLESLIPSDLQTDVDIDGTVYPFAWVKRVYDFTAQEIIDKDNEIADNEAEITINKYIADGLEAIRRLRIYLRRKYLEIPLNDAQRESIRRGLKPVVDELREGEWVEAQRYFISGEDVYINPPTNSDLLDIYNMIKNKIDQYVTNNY